VALAHLEAARDLARVMHENNISLVYGGGTVGLMGEVARTLVSLSGPDSVHGVCNPKDSPGHWITGANLMLIDHSRPSSQV